MSVIAEDKVFKAGTAGATNAVVDRYGTLQPVTLDSRTVFPLSVYDYPYINVLNHGVVGDGVTDNLAALEALIVAVNAAGGGTLFFPRGVYLVSDPVDILSNIQLKGSNRLAIIRETTNNHVLRIQDADNVTIKGLVVDQDRAAHPAPPGAHGIRVGNSSNVTIKNNTIENCTGYGIGLQEGTLTNITIDGNLIRETDADGIDFKNRNNDNSGISITNNRIFDPGLGDTDKTGIDVRGVGCIVTGNQVVLTVANANAASGIRMRPTGVTNGPGGLSCAVSNNVCICIAPAVGGPAFSVGDIQNMLSCNVAIGPWSRGFITESDIPAEFCTFSGCVADGPANGFEEKGDRNLYANCVGVNCTTAAGFRINGSNDTYLVNCVANTNLDGFRQLSTPLNVHYLNCHAASNSSAQFNTFGATSSAWQVNGLSSALPIRDGLNVKQAQVNNVPSAVNFVVLKGATAGNNPSIAVGGTDANNGLLLERSGTGLLRLGQGSDAVTTELPSRYFSIVDSGGTTRKVLIVA